MTAPRRSGAEQATTRGIIVLVFAVIVGLALLSKSNGIVGSTGVNSSDKPETTTTTASSTTAPPGTGAPVNTGDTVPPSTHAPSEVKVIVVNAAGGIPGVGQKNSDLLTAAGFNVVNIKNAAAVPATTVYFADGYQADAEAVKAAIKVTTAVVSPNPTELIVPEAAEANVTVVIGQDYTG